MKPFWLVLALLSLAATVRWRSLGRGLRLLLLALTVVLALVGTGVIALPSVDTVVQDVGRRLGSWTYLLVGVSAFLETGAFLGFIAPGETMVLFAGVLAGAGTIELLPLIAIVFVSAVLGDLCSYWIGRRYGREFLLRHGARVKVGEPQVQFVERFFERHGDLTVFLGRWIGVVRPLVPFLAGSSRLPFLRFLAVDLVAALAWSAVLATLGSVFWQNFDELSSVVGQALVLLGTVIVVVAVLGTGLAARRSPRRSAQVEAWLAEQTAGHRILARPASLGWALLGSLDRLLPSRRARRATTAPPATVDETPAASPARDPSERAPE